MVTELADARRRIATALRERREEIERAVATRVFAISEPPETSDPEYLAGLRKSLSTALEFAFDAVQRGEQRAPDLPTSLLAQARMAARNGVGLDTVLRRYFAGYSLILELILREVPTDTGALPSVLRGHAAVFDRLIHAISEEHRREAAMLLRSTAARRVDRVTRLLAGEPIDAEELGYDLDGFHLGLAGTGAGIEVVIRELAAAFSGSTLRIPLADARMWVWLGSHSPIESEDLASFVEQAATLIPPGSTLAVGEPGEGLNGWRLTHRQAVAVMPMTRRLGRRVVRYVDAGLLASVSADDLLLESLHQTYLEPLSEGRDGGKALRETLRAHLGAGGNISSAAAALGVNRETVRKRLRVAEEKIGRPINECAAELEIALRLAESESQRPRLRVRAVPSPPNRPNR